MVFTIITIEDKLELFRKVVLEKVEKEFEEKLGALEKQNVTKIEEFEVMIQQKSKDYVKGLVDQADYERKMVLSKAKAKVRTMVLQKRQGIVENLLELIKQEAKEFTKTAAYEAYLVDSFKVNIDELKRFKKTIVALDVENFDRAKSILEKEFIDAGFAKEVYVFEAANEELIGGVKFYNDNKTIRIDESFGSLIQENTKSIGQYVYDMISEAGESNE